LKSVAFHPNWPSSAVRTDSYLVDNIPPTIAAHLSQGATNGWHLAPVVVSFTCNDNALVANCSSPFVVSAEGSGQVVPGTAADTVGYQTQTSVTLNLDLTPPSVTLASPANGFMTSATSVQVIGTVSETLSGLSAVKCNDVAATVVSGQVTCTVPLRPGRNAVTLSALDAAGNNASVGVVVHRVGSASRITLTPNTLTMVVSQQATLSLLDDFGAPVTGASWSSSSPTIVSLSGANPPVLSAIATGQALVTATKNGLTSQTLITVASGTSVAAGTTRWLVPSSPVANLRRDPPIYANSIDADSPEAFIVETDVTTWERTVRATTGSGEVKWQTSISAVPLFGDSFGGLVAGIEPASNTCRAVFGEFENCYRALTRIPSSSSTLSWRYESAGLLDRPAQGPDGTIYFIEHLSGKAVVILDGATGRVTARVPLANRITDQTVFNSQDSSCTDIYGVQDPVSVGPTVGDDGFGYVLVSSRNTQQRVDCATFTIQSRNGDVGLSLLRLSSTGIVDVTAIDQSHCPPACQEPTPKQLLTDGMGGQLLVALWDSSQSKRITHLDANGGRLDVPVDPGTRIELVGQGGLAFLHTKISSTTSLEKSVVDVNTLQTLWNLPLDWNWIAPTANGEAMAERTGDFARFGPSGQISNPVTLGLISPAQRAGSWLGNTTTQGLRAVSMPFDDGTRSDASYLSLGNGFEEPRRYGNFTNQNQSQLVFHTNYNAIEIETTKSVDEIFDTYVRTFAGVNAGSYATATIPGGTISALGQRVTFTMKPLAIRFVQPPFDVEVIRYTPSERTMAARTINPVHPLFGWRYWRVYHSANGITIETGAYDRPASGLINYVGSFVGHEDQTGIWREYMQHILQSTGGVLRSSSQLMNGIWDADTLPASAAVAPNATRQNILTQVCGVAPSNISIFELTATCQ